MSREEDNTPANRIIDFHGKIAALKGTVRRGWAERSVPRSESVAERSVPRSESVAERSVPRSESVADHSFAVCALAVLFARILGTDPAKVLAMAILHDLCEAVCGDIIPSDGVPTEHKLQREKAAMVQVLAGLDESGELMELWLDAGLGRTPEGRLVKQLDTLEMILQANLYEKTTGLSLDEFFEAGTRIDIPELRAVFLELEERHQRRRPPSTA